MLGASIDDNALQAPPLRVRQIIASHPSYMGAASQTCTPLQTRRSTTVAILTRRSDLLPTGREEENERCIDRGDAGAVGRVAARGKGADAPALYAGPGSGIGGSVS